MGIREWCRLRESDHHVSSFSSSTNYGHRMVILFVLCVLLHLSAFWCPFAIHSSFLLNLLFQSSNLCLWYPISVSASLQVLWPSQVSSHLISFLRSISVSISPAVKFHVLFCFSFPLVLSLLYNSSVWFCSTRSELWWLLIEISMLWKKSYLLFSRFTVVGRKTLGIVYCKFTTISQLFRHSYFWKKWFEGF